jgi:Glycosyltransferase family 87
MIELRNVIPRRRRWRWQVGTGFVIAGIIAASVFLVAQFWPIGPDYYFTYYRTAEKWLNGETRLYDGNPTTEIPGNPDIGFFNAPWTLGLLVPLALLPLQLGEALLNVGSVLGMVLCIRALAQTKPVPLFAIVLALANLHTLDTLLRGQIDVLPLIGVVIGWWAVQSRRPLVLSLGFALIGTKPLNVALPALILLLAIREWRLADKLKAFSVPLILFGLSELIFGLDWPVRYLAYGRYLPPNDYLSTSIWRGAAQIGFPALPIAVGAGIAVVALLILAWRVGINQWLVAVALATNALFSTYIHGNHYILLIPALVVVARRDWRLAMLAYAATFTPLLRLLWGFEAARIDVVYPLILFLALWGLKLTAARVAAQSPGRSWRAALLSILAAESVDERRHWMPQHTVNQDINRESQQASAQ